MPRPPYPLCTGGDHAQFHFIGEIIKMMDVSVCFEVDDKNYYGYVELLKLWEGATFYPLINLKHKHAILDFYRWLKHIMLNFKKGILKCLRSELVQIEDPIKYYSFINLPIFQHNAGFANHLHNILTQSQFDIIQIDFISLGPLVYLLPEDVVKILVHHEIRYIRIKREMDLFKKIEAFDYCRFCIIKDEEIALLRRFNQIVTLTETDKNILSEDIDPSKIYVSPATIPFIKKNELPFKPFINRLVFIGSSRHLPNTDGIEWFIQEVLPEMEKQIPEIKLEIIGDWELPYRKKYQKGNVSFFGFIDKLETVLPGSLLIVPLRIGSGMRLKVIEALNMEIPFISTSIGVEGLNLESMKECIIADNAADFINGICSIANQIALQKQMVINASLKLQTEFSYNRAIKKRVDFYNLIF